MGSHFFHPQSLSAVQDISVPIDQIGVGVILFDAESRITAANLRACKILGYHLHELLGKTFDELTAPEDRSLSAELDGRLQAGELDRVNYEKRYLRSDGTSVWVHVSVVAMRDEDSVFRGVITTVEDISERQHVQSELRAAHGKYLGIIDSAMDAIISVNDQQQIVVFNTAAEQMFRCRAAEALGSSLERFVPAQFRGTHAEYIRRFGATGTTKRSMRSPGTLMAVRADGEEFPIEATISQTTLQGERLYTVIMRDITERKRSEDKLREQARLLDLSFDAILIRGQQDEIRYWNQGAERHYGFSREEALGMQSHELLQTKFPAPLDEILTMLRREKYWVGELVHRRKDGSTITVASRWSLDPDTGMVLETNTDVTHRRIAEEALRQGEQRFRALAENIPQKIWVADANSTFQYLSSKWLEYTGTTAEQNVGGGWIESVHPDDRAVAQELWNGAVQSHGRFEAEYRLRRSDGEYRWHLARAAHMLNPGTGEDLWFGTTTDIQDQKRAQGALIRSEKLASVGRMAATVAHEINNPLELIMNLVYLASLDKNLNPKTRESLQTAEQELERVAHLTRQTLGFYRENSAPIEVDVTGLVRDVVQMYAPKLIQRDIRIKFERSDKVHVHGVAGEIRQVVSNLVSNAIDASSHGGELKIRTSSMLLKGGRFVRVTLADTGEGIRRENLQRIFEPFFTTKESVGTGLGLWVSSEIVLRHQGKLRVRSCTGRGTVFTIFLPQMTHPTH